MASPQTENGYTKIANELMGALARFRIPGEEMQCFMFIVRKTYGYNKKKDVISNSQFVKATGMRKGNVSRALKKLIEKNIVIKSDNKTIPTYRINKDYMNWKVLSKKQPVIKKATGVIKSDNKPLSKVRDTKERKKLLQKKGKTFVPPPLEEVKNYFKENGFSVAVADKAFRYYSAAAWKDSRGNQVRNWKQKMIAVWFKDENREKQEFQTTARLCKKCGTATWRSLTAHGICEKCKGGAE